MTCDSPRASASVSSGLRAITSRSDFSSSKVIRSSAFTARPLRPETSI